MANADGSVVIQVDLSVSEAEKEENRLKKKILKLKEELSAKNAQKGAFTKELQDAKKELQELEKYAKRDAKGNPLNQSAYEADKLTKHISSLESKILKTNDAITATNAALDGTYQRYKEVNQEADRLRQQEEAKDRQPEGEEGQQLSGMERARALAQEGLTSLKNGFMELARLTRSGIANVFKGIGSVIKKAFTGGAQAVKTFGKGLLGAAKNLNVFTKLSDGLGSKLSRLGGMIRRVFVFSVITKGLRSVRSAFSTMLSQNTELSASLARLKGVLLTAFQPIYDVIVPALNTLINVLTSALAVVAQFMANLFGRTAKSAQAGAKALNSEAGAIKGTGKAAEEAAGSLAGFDEINTITTENAGGGGGAGGGGASAAPLFDYEFDDQPPFDSWEEAFNAFLDNILAGIPRLREAFTQFAAGLNDFTRRLLEMFTFPGVKEKVVMLGQELAAAFNELVANINWHQLGQALGAGFNLAILFLTNLIYGFDWINLGTSLAAGFNGLVAEIDWLSFGALLWSGFKIGLETLAGFLIGLNMSEIAKAASDIAIGFFDSVTETLQKIDWEEIGHQVKEFLVNVDWGGVAESVFTTIGSAFGAAAAFLWGLIKDAWKKVVDWWHETAFEDGEFTLQGLLDGIVEVIRNIGTWIREHIFQPFIDGFKSIFGINSPSAVMEEQGGYIMDGLLVGLKEKLRPITDFFNKSLGEDIKTALGGLTDFISGIFSGDWKKAWNGVKNIFKGVWNGIIGFLESAINFIIDGINGLIAMLNKIHFEFPEWVPGVGGKSFGINIPAITELSIPRLAQGAVIPPNREFMAVLGDQKKGTNIEAPEALIRRIVREETANMMGGDQTVILQIDRTQLGKVVYKLNKAETRRIGVNLAGV